MILSPLVKKIITGTLVVSISYSGYAYFFKKSTSSTTFTTVTTTVKKGNIENSVQVIGTSALVYEQKMQFSQAGKVAKILFKEGDTVKKGDIMAELDTTDVLNDIKQQEVNVTNAQVKLTQLIKGATDKDLLNAENTVTSAKSKIITLENSKKNLLIDQENKQRDFQSQILSKQNDIKSKQAQLANAKNELATLEKTQSKGLTDTDTDVTKVLDTAFTDARKQIIDAESSLYNADVILGISDTNRTKNDTYETYLSAKNTVLKTQAENDWRIANTLVSQAKTSLNILPTTENNSVDIKALLSLLNQVFDSLIILGKDGTDAMNASIISSTLSQTTIDGYAGTFSSITSASQSSLSAIKTTIANIDKLTDPTLIKASNDNALSTKRQSIADQEFALEQAERDLIKLQSDMIYSASTYDAQIVAQDISIQDAQNSFKYNEANLELLRAGATKEEIALAKNSITSQQLALQKVKENIKKYQLEAPFDGVLRKIDFKLGDNIITSSSVTPEYLYIENPNLVEITATVDQLDVVKLKLGQDAKIVFDSFPTLTLTGKVSDINSTPTQTSGVTSYTIKVSMDKGNHPIFSGMSAKVDIIIESNQNTLIVPTSFVQKGRSGGTASVLKRIGTVDIKTDVELGISNPSNTEIKSGVNEGDILTRKINTSVGTTPTTSGLQIPGTGGGGGTRSSNFNRGG
ncbi:MAG: biotin/lipoyl-binding protein [Candidatus Gracilibacteria bacterium]|nr:biotin/lipoyl-binding protein [Candidatus Gracilibacteria bacterium]